MERDDWQLAGGLVLIGLAARYLFVSRDSEGTIMSGGILNVKLTGYWPFLDGLSASERLMEGGLKDSHGNPLHTLEDHLANPSEHPYVSVSGDDAIWPYGQRIEIANWPGAIFRVVDTGGHFRGLKKVYRVAGYEPLDICVAGPSTGINPSLSFATIVEGDKFMASRGPQEVQTDRFVGQSLG